MDALRIIALGIFGCVLAIGFMLAVTLPKIVALLERILSSRQPVTENTFTVVGLEDTPANERLIASMSARASRRGVRS